MKVEEVGRLMPFKVKDHFYKQAKKQKYFARSVYKLEEINKKFKVLNEGGRVLDLGYHPGSWIQYASQIVGERGVVVGVDLRPVHKQLLFRANVKLYQKDIHELCSLADIGEGQKFDTMLSDMAPKTTGIKTVDQAQSLELVEQAFKILPAFLQKGGNFVFKLFESSEAHAFLRGIGKEFSSFHRIRPQSTRSISKEFFAIGESFKL